MDQSFPPNSLHPNLARIAAAYDMIIERMNSRQLTAMEARAQIEQLEARDDQGVRWSIDPDSGQFMRKTLMGDMEFDTPPVFGFATEDAYSYSATRGSETDPNTRMEMFAAPDARLVQAPSDLAGATRNGPAAGGGHHGPNLLASVPTAYKAAAAAVLVLLVLAFLLS